jgi:hypothetical protein
VSPAQIVTQFFRLDIHPAMASPSFGGRTARPVTLVGYEPFGGGLGVVREVSRIDQPRRIGVERTSPDFWRIAGKSKPVLMFRFLVMHAHLVTAQNDQHKLTRRINHRLAPPLCRPCSG